VPEKFSRRIYNHTPLSWHLQKKRSAIIDTLYRAHHGWLTAWLRKKMACSHNVAGGRKNMPEKQPAMLHSQLPKEWSVCHATGQLSDQNWIIL
jgi:hypothetical protein